MANVLASMTTSKHGTGRRVLIAEDDDDLREMLAVALQSEGYEVIVANDGADLLDRLATHLGSAEQPADLIVSDIFMPCWSGLQVLAEIKHGRWNLPVILITAARDAITLNEAERLGAAALFQKPFDIYDFLTAVLNLLPPPLHSSRGAAQSFPSQPQR